MKRRGFLSFLGGAAVAGPAMAKQAVVGIEAMALPTIPMHGPIGDLVGGIGGPYASGDEYDHAKWLRSRIAEVTGISDSQRRERMKDVIVTSLDPDLAANRSFSLAAKIDMQKRRNVDRQLDYQHRNFLRQLADHLAGKETYF